MIVDDIKTATVVLDGSGNGRCYVVPRANEIWAPILAQVSTSTSVSESTAFLYRGSTSLAIDILDSTFMGSGDGSGKVGGVLYYTGQAIWAVWLGGDPGAIATLRVTIKKGAPGDNNVAAPVGAGFTAQTLSPDQIAAGLVNSTLASVMALAVSNQGVPAIDKPQTVSVVFNQSIAAGATFTSPALDFSRYQSVVGTIFAQEASAPGGTSPFMRVRFSWSLQADNFDPLITEDWVPSVGAFSFVHNNRNDYSSPCFGDTLTVSVFNYDSKAINLTWGLFGSYRARTRSVMRGRYPDDLSTEANGLGSDDLLLSFQFNNVLTGTQSPKQIADLFEGPVTCSMNTGGGPANNTVFMNIDFQPGGVLLGTTSYNFPNDVTNVMLPRTVTFPRRACLVSVSNNSGATLSPSVLLIGQVQPS